MSTLLVMITPLEFTSVATPIDWPGIANVLRVTVSMNSFPKKLASLSNCANKLTYLWKIPHHKSLPLKNDGFGELFCKNQSCTYDGVVSLHTSWCSNVCTPSSDPSIGTRMSRWCRFIHADKESIPPSVNEEFVCDRRMISNPIVTVQTRAYRLLQENQHRQMRCNVLLDCQQADWQLLPLQQWARPRGLLSHGPSMPSHG